MQPTPENINTLVLYLRESNNIDLQKRRQAEQFLLTADIQAGFPVLLLQLIQMNEADPGIRQAAAVQFKNLVKRRWKIEETQISEGDRAQIKSVIVNMMLSSPKPIQKQLSAALEIISEVEFPMKWTELLPQLVARLNTQDMNVVLGVFKTANSLLKRYRFKEKTDGIVSELILILQQFAQPYAAMFQQIDSMVQQNASNVAALVTLFPIVLQLVKIYFSLNAVDLPEVFEDSLQTYMTFFMSYLKFHTTAPELVGDEDDEKPGILLKVQAEVCKVVRLYTEHYEEEFAPYLPSFVKEIWEMLIRIGPQTKNDNLVTNGISVLNSVSTGVNFPLFQDPETLKSLCEKVIIPNMQLRQADIELFEDNPVEYIAKDIEGTEMDTRRRAATVFVKGLRKNFEAPVTQICAGYLNQMLQLYASNPKTGWISKDAAIYLITALAVRGATTAVGESNVNQLVPVMEFFGSQILPELQAQHSEKTLILKSDALKFVFTFRQLIPRDAYTTLMPLLINCLLDQNYVVHTYAAVCVERILTVKDGPVQFRFGRADVKPMLEPLLGSIFKSLEIQSSKENPYLMKALMRITAVAQEDIVQFSNITVPRLVQILARVAANPTNPTFNHYLFETISSTLRAVASTNKEALAAFEKLLFTPFLAIFQQDIQDFHPYVFQVLAFCLELGQGPLNPNYEALLPNLLVAPLWERTGNIPGLVRLLQAYLRRAPQLTVANGRLEPMLGIWQKLTASKVQDHEGFYLLESIVEYLQPSDFARYLPGIFDAIFKRLSSSKTTKLVRSFLVFLAVFVCKHGAKFVVDAVNSLQPGVFGMVINSLWLEDAAKVTGIIERKLIAIASTKLMTETTTLLEPQLIKLWPKLLHTTVLILQGAQDERPTEGASESDDFVDLEEPAGYRTAYARLVHAYKTDVDPLPGVEPRAYLASQLQQLSRQMPGKVGALVSEAGPEMSAVVMSYFQAAGLPQPYIQ